MPGLKERTPRIKCHRTVRNRDLVRTAKPPAQTQAYHSQSVVAANFLHTLKSWVTERKPFLDSITPRGN